MSTVIDVGSMSITVPDYIVCLDQEEINNVRNEGDPNEKIIGCGEHSDGKVTLILASGEVLIFNPEKYHIPSGPYLPQDDGYTIFLPNNNKRWPGPSRGFSVQSLWIIQRSSRAINDAELFIRDKSLGKFDFKGIETNES